MNVTVPQHTIVQPPPVHVGYHQAPPVVTGSYARQQVVQTPTQTVVRRTSRTDMVHQPPMPVYQQPPAQLQTTFATQRVPLSTNHSVMVPVTATQQETVMEPVESTVHEVHQVPTTVMQDVTRTVPVQTTRTREVPHTEYHQVSEQVPVMQEVTRTIPVQTTRTVTEPHTEYHQVTEQVPTTVMRDQVVEKKVVNQVPRVVTKQVTQSVPANVVVTHW